MPEQFLQLAPPSPTGKKVHTRERTVGANVVQDQYVLNAKPQIVSTRVYYSSLRVPNRALTATAMSQPMFSIWNGGANQVSVRRLSVESDTAVIKAQYSPWLRLYRITAAPTGGTAVTAMYQDTADPAVSAAVVASCDAQTDGNVATTPLAATPNPTAAAWCQTVPRWHTLANFQVLPVLNMVPDDSKLNAEDPLILRPNQGCLVRCEAVSATYVAADWTFMFKAVIGEFTIP